MPSRNPDFGGKVKKKNSVPSPKARGAKTRLLPCPFCGGKGEPDALMIGAAGQDNATPCGHFIECQSCLAMTGASDSFPEAIEKWNRREAPSAKPAPSLSTDNDRFVKRRGK
jgi:Lar family restriction alleviation protein